MKSMFVGVCALAAVALCGVARAQECKSHPRMASGQDVGLRRAPDGAMWYASANANRIVRMDGNFKESPFVPVNGANNGLSGLVLADGHVWFTKTHPGVVGRFPLEGGEGVEFELPEEAGFPRALVRGPDGALWYFDPVRQKLGRVTPDGAVTVVPAPPRLNPFSPSGMTPGIDNSLWITDDAQNALFKLDLATLQYKRYDIPEPQAHPAAIRVASDGTVWFGMTAARKLGRMSPRGVFSSIDLGGAAPRGLHIAEDGTVWFNDNQNFLRRIRPDGTMDKFKCGEMFGPLNVADDGSVWALGNNRMLVFRETNTQAPRVASTAVVAAPAKASGAGAKVREVTLPELRKLFEDRTARLVVHYTILANKGCGYCDQSFAIFDEFAGRNSAKATFVRLAADWKDPVWKDAWLRGKTEIKGLPTFVTYYDQLEVARVNGRYATDVLEARLLPAR